MPSQLSALLVQDRVVSFRQMDAAVRAQQRDGGHIGTCLLERDAIDEGILLYYSSKFARVAGADRDAFRAIPPLAFDAVDRDWALRNRAVPIGLEGGAVLVAAVEPLSESALQQLGKPVEQRVAVELRVVQALHELYDAPLEERYRALLERYPAQVAVAANAPPVAAASTPVSTASELAGLTWPLEQLSSFLATSTDRDGMLMAVLGFLGKFFPRRMLLVAGRTTVRGYALHMPGKPKRPIARIELPLSEGELTALVSGDTYFIGPCEDAGLAGLYDSLGVARPPDCLVLPVRVGPRAALLLVGDNGAQVVNRRALPVGTVVTRQLSAALERLIRDIKLRHSASLPSVNAEAPSYLSTDAEPATGEQAAVAESAKVLLSRSDARAEEVTPGLHAFDTADWALPDDWDEALTDVFERPSEASQPIRGTLQFGALARPASAGDDLERIADAPIRFEDSDETEGEAQRAITAANEAIEGPTRTAMFAAAAEPGEAIPIDEPLPAPPVDLAELGDHASVAQESEGQDESRDEPTSTAAFSTVEPTTSDEDEANDEDATHDDEANDEDATHDDEASDEDATRDDEASDESEQGEEFGDADNADDADDDSGDAPTEKLVAPRTVMVSPTTSPTESEPITKPTAIEATTKPSAQVEEREEQATPAARDTQDRPRVTRETRPSGENTVASVLDGAPRVELSAQSIVTFRRREADSGSLPVVPGTSAHRRAIELDVSLPGVLQPETRRDTLSEEERRFVEIVVAAPSDDLIAWLSEDDTTRRNAAFVELLNRGPKAFDALRDAFPGPLRINRRAEMASDRSPLEEHGPLIWLCALQLLSFRLHLTDLLQHENADARYYASRMLLQAADPLVISPMVDRLFDTDSQIREIALHFVRTFIDHDDRESVLKRIRRALSANEAWVAEAAIHATADLVDLDAIPALLELLDHGSAHTRQRAAQALSRLTFQDHGVSQKQWNKWYRRHGMNSRYEWLLDAMVDKDWKVRDNAARELRTFSRLTVNYHPDLSRAAREQAARQVHQYLYGRTGGRV